jgi:hypothetical protein
MNLHCKKRLAAFPSPACGCHLPNSPWSGIIKKSLFMIFCFELVYICPPPPPILFYFPELIFMVYCALSVDLQQNKLSLTRAEILSTFPIDQIDQISLSSYLCLNGWPMLDRKLSSDQQHSAICVRDIQTRMRQCRGGGPKVRLKSEHLRLYTFTTTLNDQRSRLRLIRTFGVRRRMISSD